MTTIISSIAQIKEPIYFNRSEKGLHIWMVSTLLQASHGSDIYELSTSQFSTLLDKDFWFQDQENPTILNIARHCRKIIGANLDSPIILTSSGDLLDGFHRLARAWLENKTYIKAVKLQSMPAPDFLLPHTYLSK